MSKALDVTIDTFDPEVLQSGSPVLVDFWAGWCMPCRILGPVVDEVAGNFAGKVKVVKVDVDSNQSLAEKFGIRGIPTLLFFNKGELAQRLVGVQPKDQIVRTLNALLGA